MSHDKEQANSTPEQSKEFFITQLIQKGRFSYLPQNGQDEITFDLESAIANDQEIAKKLAPIIASLYRARFARLNRVGAHFKQLLVCQITSLINERIDRAVAAEHGTFH